MLQGLRGREEESKRKRTHKERNEKEKNGIMFESGKGKDRQMQ